MMSTNFTKNIVFVNTFFYCYLKYKVSIIVFYVDPHVRIAGLPEDVKTAKMQVMSVLDDRVRIFHICVIFYLFQDFNNFLSNNYMTI